MLSISIHMQKFVKFYQFVLKILSENEILTSIKGHNSVRKFGQISAIYSQDNERKRNSDINQGPQLCYKFAKIDA